MDKHEWVYDKVGDRTSVRIIDGDDIRHLGELDQKFWSVLSCPVSGLEIPRESLTYIDLDGDGSVHVSEVIKVSEWLCSVLVDPNILFSGKDSLELSAISDLSVKNKATKIVGHKESISLSDINSFICSRVIDLLPLPALPYDEDIMSAFSSKSEEYVSYYRLEKLSHLGLGTMPEDIVRPVMTSQEFEEMSRRIQEYEKAAEKVREENRRREEEVKEEYNDVLKLLLLCRDFCRLLRNFVNFEDFYNRSRVSPAMFQAGYLVIDQRICHLTMCVNDMSKHEVQADKSGMFLLYCDCFSKTLNASMKIVSAVTVGDVNNLSIGKNAIFYDMAGNDWDATVYKIIDNPISIRQAFWSPYRKFGNWITELINKTAEEKDKKNFEDVTTKVKDTTSKGISDDSHGHPQPFDIARFAGIFAAISMAFGFLGSFLTDLAKGVHALPWWQVLVCIVSLFLVISLPSMVIAWLKLRRRNLAPLLNANGWAVNADAIVSVLFGKTLTEIAQFPIIKISSKRSQSKRIIGFILVISMLLVVIGMVILYREGSIELFNK